MAKTKGIGFEISEDDLPAPAGNKHLLLIGIDQYAHCPKLSNCVRDVDAFGALMYTKYGFAPERTYWLRNAEATADAIVAALKHLIRTVGPDDTAVIYFAGHGELDPDFGEGFWIPVEARPGARTQYLSNDTVQRALERINSFHTFLIVDACYAGALFLDAKSRFISDAYDFASRWGLTSGRNTIVSDGAEGGHSPFATALLDTLGRLDRPMNVGALCDVVKQYVPAATQKRQMPIGDPLAVNGHKGGQLVFVPIPFTVDSEGPQEVKTPPKHKEEARAIPLVTDLETPKDAAAPAPAKVVAPAAPSAARQAISELERKGYEQQLALSTQKLQYLQKALILETDPSKQFALEHEIGKLEERIETVKWIMDD